MHSGTTRNHFQKVEKNEGMQRRVTFELNSESEDDSRVLRKPIKRLKMAQEKYGNDNRADDAPTSHEDDNLSYMHSSFVSSEDNADQLGTQLEDNANTSLYTNVNDGKSIGQQIMERMGYESGKGLGKNAETSILQPIEVHMKGNRAGVGAYSIKRKSLGKESVEDYRARMRQSNKFNEEQRDLRRLMKLCFDFEHTAEEFYRDPCSFPLHTVNTLWRQYVLDEVLRKEAKNDKAKIVTIESAETEERRLIKEWSKIMDYEFQEILSKDVSSRNESLVLHLRQVHNYCFYCGYSYENKDDMDKNCPGIRKEDHAFA